MKLVKKSFFARRGDASFAPGMEVKPPQQSDMLDQLDVEFYTRHYTDLAHMSPAEAKAHYSLHGIPEGRLPNAKALVDALENERRKLPEDFDPAEYLAANPDLSLHLDIKARPWMAAIHYLKHGRWEGRKYTHRDEPFVYTSEVLHRMTANIYNMPEVVVDSRRTATVNVLVPAFDIGSMSAGFFGVFHVALFLKQCGYTVRLVMYDEFHFDKAVISEKLRNYPGLETLLEDLEVEHIGGREAPLRVSPRDSCVATVWYSAYLARKIMAALGGGKFVYLIQDYEPAFYPGGSLFAFAQATYSFDHGALFSTKALQDHFLRYRIGIFSREGMENSTYFNNACNCLLKPEKDFIEGRAGKAKSLVFYSRPQVHRNMFELGALALQMAYSEGVFAGDEWKFFGVGLGQPAIELGPGVNMKQLERMNLRDYRETVSTFDVGLSLMASFHPSLVPFDLAGSGVKVVTNSFGIKDQAYFDSLAHGIIVSEPEVHALVVALRKAVAESADLNTRYRDAKNMKFPQSWADSFSENHVEFFRKIFEKTPADGVTSVPVRRGDFADSSRNGG